MADNLNKLDEDFATAFHNGRMSLFRAAFEFLGDDESIKKEVESSAQPLPHLRIACFLQDFYDYADGRDYRNQWLVHNRRVDLSKTWQSVFHKDVNLREVKSKAWILSGECRGQASDIWRVIKACAAKKSEDGADRFDASSYVNDDVPRQIRLILDDYQTGGIVGAEFVSFIEAFLRNGEGADPWLVPLVTRAIEHFPSSVDFTAAGYLIWDGRSSERADLIFGIDHVRGVLSGRLTINGSVSTTSITTGFKAIGLPATTLPFYDVRFMGVEDRIPASPIGVYYRYQLNDSSRRSWWVRVRSDGTFPYNRDEILAVFADGENESLEFGEDISIDGIRRTRVNCSGQWYLFVSARVTARPESARSVKIAGQSVTFAGIAPSIRLGTATAQSIWADDAVVADMPTRVEVTGIADDMSCRWSINGHEVPCDGSSLTLPIPQGGMGESRVRVAVRKAGRIYRRLSINVFHVPAEISTLVGSGEKLPQGWSLESGKAEKREDCIALRVAGRRAALLKGPNNVSLPVLVEDRSVAWWVEMDMVRDRVTESFRDISLFTRMSDLEGAYLCVPSDLGNANLTVEDNVFPVSRWQPKDGVVRIPLEKVAGAAGDREFRYAGNVPELHFELDGHLVGVVAAVPKIPTLCRHVEGDRLGVFLPKRTKAWAERFLALAYRDTPIVSEIYAIPETLTDGAIEWKRDAGDQFVPIAPALDVYLKRHPRGDVFVVLVNENRWNKYSCTLANPFFLKADAQCQILLIRKDLAPYSADEIRVAKQLKSAWGEHLAALPQGHPLKELRIASFEGALRYDECLDYWRDVAGTPSVWKTAFRVMLDSGFNPLLEPEWFNQSVDQLIENVRLRLGRNRVTRQLAEEVLSVLLDNRDARSDSFSGVRGEGLCPALVARRQILQFADLVPTKKESWFINREQTILDSRPISRLGFYGVFASINGYSDIRHPVSSAKNGELVFSGSNGREILKLERGGWRRTDDRRKSLSLHAFALSEANGAPQIFALKTSDIDEDETSWADRHCGNEECRQLMDLGVSLSSRLSHGWTKELFAGTFEALRNKGCCDTAVVRALGLVVCLQSILADKDRALCLKADDPGYGLSLRLTRVLFNGKYLDGEDGLWREMMRFITAYLGMHTYLDIPIDQIKGNANS